MKNISITIVTGPQVRLRLEKVRRICKALEGGVYSRVTLKVLNKQHYMNISKDCCKNV